MIQEDKIAAMAEQGIPLSELLRQAGLPEERSDAKKEQNGAEAAFLPLHTHCHIGAGIHMNPRLSAFFQNIGQGFRNLCEKEKDIG